MLAWHRAPGREGWLVTGLVAVRPLRPAPRQAVSSSPRRSLWREGQQVCTPREVPRTPPALVQRGSRLLQCNEAASSPQSRAAQHARLAVRGRLPGAQAQSGTSRGAPQPSAVRASPSRLGRRGCETLARTRGASATSPVPSATGHRPPRLRFLSGPRTRVGTVVSEAVPTRAPHSWRRLPGAPCTQPTPLQPLRAALGTQPCQPPPRGSGRAPGASLRAPWSPKLLRCCF